MPTTTKTDEKKNKKTKALEYEISFGNVSLTQKAFFAKNLAVMLKAGLNIIEALEISADSSTSKLKKALKGIMQSVESGRSLSESLRIYPKIFPAFFISAVFAGEESGTLDENLEQVATQLKKEKDLSDKIKGAMVYPLVVLSAAFVLGLFVSFYILPKILPLFEGFGQNLPITTRMLIVFSHFIEQYKGQLIIFLITFFISMAWLLKQKFTFPVTHYILLKFPIIKTISRGANMARFARTLGTMLASGLNIDEALRITSTAVSNYHYQTTLKKVEERVTKGSSLSMSLQEYEQLFPRITTRMIKVGEESGKLDETLLYVANFYEEEVDNSTKALSTALEPILLIGIGVAVGFLALAIITPIYQITGSIKG
ncbi:MAG: type II secretion system F family protein [Candidatus Falkowbacteria bacterium]|nr:type II secretion system F family protein [Candidatus Falkowbacteria bacterium]